LWGVATLASARIRADDAKPRDVLTQRSLPLPRECFHTIEVHGSRQRCVSAALSGTHDPAAANPGSSSGAVGEPFCRSLASMARPFAPFNERPARVSSRADLVHSLVPARLESLLVHVRRRDAVIPEHSCNVRYAIISNYLEHLTVHYEVGYCILPGVSSGTNFEEGTTRCCPANRYSE
jgi:hypothetical protein